MKGSLFYRSVLLHVIYQILARGHHFCNSTESTIAYNVDHVLQKEIEVNISFSVAWKFVGENLILNEFDIFNVIVWWMRLCWIADLMLMQLQKISTIITPRICPLSLAAHENLNSKQGIFDGINLLRYTFLFHHIHCLPTSMWCMASTIKLNHFFSLNSLQQLHRKRITSSSCN